MATEPNLVNGRAYDYTQIRFNVLGVNIAGVKAITYIEEQPKENNFGTGTKPVSRGHGAINANASVELSMNDVEALRDVAPEGKLLKIPAFDIPVIFENPQGVQTHILKNFEFLDDGVEGSQGDTDLSRTFGAVISEVKYR